MCRQDVTSVSRDIHLSHRSRKESEESDWGATAETSVGGESPGCVLCPDPTRSAAELAGTTQGVPLLTTRPENLSVALLTLP